MALAGPRKKKVRIILIIILSRSNIEDDAVFDTLHQQVSSATYLADIDDDPLQTLTTDQQAVLDVIDSIHECLGSGSVYDLQGLNENLSDALSVL